MTADRHGIAQNDTNITAVLSEISSYGGFFTLDVAGAGRNWQPIGRAYDDGYTDLINATLDRYDTTDRRVGASLVHLGHAARLWSPVLACVLGHGVVPDLTHLQRAEGGPQLRLPDPVGQPVDQGGVSPDMLYRIVVQQHLEPLAAGLRVKLAPGLLHGNIASALVGAAQALLVARPDLSSQTVEMTRALLSTQDLVGTGSITGRGLDFRRRSCCLFYRVPAGSKCGDCVLSG